MVRSTPTLLSLGEEQFCIPAGLVKDQPSTSSVVVAGGIPPLPLKILEKVRKWEYVDLTTLLSNDHSGETPASLMVSANGQTLIVNLPDHQLKKRKVTLTSTPGHKHTRCMQLLSHQQRPLLNQNQLVFWLTCTMYYNWQETWGQPVVAV